jgi:membrane-associated phospholipid phosphatase
MSNSEPKMHWLYFIFGGFIIGILAAIFSGALWSLSAPLLKLFGVAWTPSKFIRRCWGHW